MKKTALFVLLVLVAFSLNASMSVEVGTGVSNICTDEEDALFFDGEFDFDAWTFYLNWRGKDNLFTSASWTGSTGIINHQGDLFSRFIFGQGGFTGISYMAVLNLSIKGFYFNLGAGAEGALSYSLYTKTPLFILSPQYRVRLGYCGDYYHISLFLENNYRYEREWNAKSSAGVDVEFALTSSDFLTLDLSFTSAEVLMDPYRVLYAYRMRAGYRRII